MLSLLGAAALVSGAVLYASSASAPAAPGALLQPDNPAIVSRGEAVYVENCASCHGADLEGQPNWRERDDQGMLPAPPHDASGHTWHHDGQTLFALTKYGLAKLIGDPNYKSNMPAYDGVLSDADIVAVLSYIKSTWPDEIREMHDQMEQR